MASVVVVGGGVIGCAVAERLARDGHRVTLLERDSLGSHASGAAAGLLAPFTESSRPGRFLELAVRSFSLFPELARRLSAESGIDVEYARSEGLAVAFGDDEWRRLRETEQWLPAEAGARVLEPRRALEVEPGLSGDIAGGMLVAQARVAPRRLVRALARSAARRGAEIRVGTPALALTGSGSGLSGVRMAGGPLEADWVVLAAGPWSPLLGLTVGIEIEVVPRRGQLVALAPADLVLGRILTSGSRYLVPKPDGTVIAGSTEEEAGFDDRPTAGGVLDLLRFGLATVPGLRGAAVERVWAALRPATSDELPLIGPAPGCENLVVATGHHRNGILLAPVTAEIVARGIAGSWEPVRA